jgi:hypothetical protein
MLRTNGGVFDMIEDFPFMLRPSKHSEPFFNNLYGCAGMSAGRPDLSNPGKSLYYSLLRRAKTS